MIHNISNPKKGITSVGTVLLLGTVVAVGGLALMGVWKVVSMTSGTDPVANEEKQITEQKDARQQKQNIGSASNSAEQKSKETGLIGSLVNSVQDFFSLDISVTGGLAPSTATTIATNETSDKEERSAFGTTGQNNSQEQKSSNNTQTAANGADQEAYKTSTSHDNSRSTNEMSLEESVRQQGVTAFKEVNKRNKKRCGGFSENLKACTPYECEMIVPLIQARASRKVVGEKEGLCKMTQEVPGSSAKIKIHCGFTQGQRLKAAKFFKESLENTSNTISISASFGDTGEEDTQSNENQNLLMQYLQQGVCEYKSANYTYDSEWSASVFPERVKADGRLDLVMKEYSQSEPSLSFVHPTDWRIQKSASGYNFNLMIHGPRLTDTTQSLQIAPQITVNWVDMSQDDPNEYLNQVKNSREQKSSHVATTRITLEGDVTGYLIENSSHSTHSMRLIFAYGDMFYSVHGKSTKNMWNKYEDTFREVLMSVSI